MLRWEEVARVAAVDSVQDDYRLTVTARDGREIAFDGSLGNVRRLHVRLLRAASGQVAPPAGICRSRRPGPAAGLP